MTDHKADLIHQLDAQRDDLWALLNGIDPAVELYPGWFKREFFAHIAGWEAAVFEIFRDHIAGVPFKTYSHNNLHDVDGANNAFVAERARNARAASCGSSTTPRRCSHDRAASFCAVVGGSSTFSPSRRSSP